MILNNYLPLSPLPLFLWERVRVRLLNYDFQK